MDQIKDIVNKVVGDISSKNNLYAEKIHEKWDNIARETGLKDTKISAIREKAVYVDVKNPAWLYRCRIKKNRILSIIKKDFPEIENIYFRIG